MSFLFQYLKNGLVYSFIGLFVLGGVMVISHKNADAAVFFDSASLGATDEIFSYNGSNGLNINDTGLTFPIGGHISGIWINWDTATVHCFEATDHCNDMTIRVEGLHSGGGFVVDVPHAETLSSGWHFLASFDSDLGSITVGDSISFTFYGASDARWQTAGSVSVPRAIFVGDMSDFSPTDTLSNITRFISVSPANGSTTATTTNLGSLMYINPNTTDQAGSGYARLHIHAYQDSEFACINSGAVYDAITTCAGSNAPAAPFDLDFGTSTLTKLIAGTYDQKELITFPAGGVWNISYEIQNVSAPWYYLGLVNNYDTVVSTSTKITVGQPSLMDIAREAVASSTARANELTQSGIGAILASTTRTLAYDCNLVSTHFSMGDCVTDMVWPGSDAIADDFTILKQLPPWGYAFRFIDILTATSTATTSIPKVSYTLGSTSPFYGVMTDITFDPGAAIAEAGDMIKNTKSDQASQKNLWEIVMPAVNIIIYMFLGFMIIKDLTDVHRNDKSPQRRDRNSLDKNT